MMRQISVTGRNWQELAEIEVTEAVTKEEAQRLEEKERRRQIKEAFAGGVMYGMDHI